MHFCVSQNWKMEEKMVAKWANLLDTSSQGQTGKTSKVENIHLELPTEVQLRWRHQGRTGNTETSRKGEISRGADPAPWGRRAAG